VRDALLYLTPVDALEVVCCDSLAGARHAVRVGLTTWPNVRWWDAELWANEQFFLSAGPLDAPIRSPRTRSPVPRVELFDSAVMPQLLAAVYPDITFELPPAPENPYPYLSAALAE
jgi:hypothetical protein